MSEFRVLKVAVVGHTNTGKTSLLRTLSRDIEFGEVSDRPATTRHVEGTTLLVDGKPLVELFDTPGLEDSIALLDHLDSLRGDRRADGVELVNRFLSSADAGPQGRFSQEAKALRQVLACDVALYVIDVRDRVLGKHRDELEILSRCARPVVPVLNFIASPEAQTTLWRDHLSRANMHAVAEFDTVVLDEHSERRLLEKMRTLLDRHRETLDALMQERDRLRAGLIRASADMVADMLIDAAAHIIAVPVNEASQSTTAIEAFRDRIRNREQQCVEQLLRLHRFRAQDYQAGDLPVTQGGWSIDLFSPAAMKQFGIRTGSAAAAGALAGLTIDAMVGGMSLGAATAVGAAIGAVLGTVQTHARRIIDQARGYSHIRCDDNTLRLLLARQTSLISALLRRGHASMQPIRSLDQPSAISNQRSTESLEATADNASIRRLPGELDEAKLHPQWSRLDERSDPRAIAGPARRASQNGLARAIERNVASSKPRAATH